MFFHGINYQHMLFQYPILSPRLTIKRQKMEQKKDRIHLVERFGFEPVHFLESSDTYSIQNCLESCFSFGNVVVVFKELPLPMLQLSKNEVGVPAIDLRLADYFVVETLKLMSDLRKIFPKTPIFYFNQLERISPFIQFKRIKLLKKVRIGEYKASI
ncbi:hypothetical protein BHF71_06840 [Vulcanibacillus modesticaldus]|uniref:Uncharacterized protein n=1 Tax=Vulcanibacillus modesticaldus TaxID=337097 RepID=A0A1D2YW78_9BACI|nr:hypothetical protein [Vulcanibacillus modesticaldus]OEF99984.1 hypothetical protein BHF71_06840 [Vulcanibacillus modesticaldus]